MVQENLVYREEQPASMLEYTPPSTHVSPMMPALSVSSSASTSAATRRRLLKSSTFQASPKNPTEMELATEIGQGLLSEVRKLQGALQQTQDSLTALELEKTDYQQEIDSLKKQLKQRSDSQDHYKEEIWNLELAKQELVQQVQELTQSMQRSSAEQARLLREEAMLTHEIDQLRTAQETYKDTLEQLQQSHEQELVAIKKSFAKADRDKRSLHHGARNNETNAKTGRAAESALSFDHANLDSDSSTPLQEEGSPETVLYPNAAAQRANQKKDLEVETLQSSLAHAHSVMRQLEQNLTSERQERAEVDKLLREAQETIEHGKHSAAWAPSSPIQIGSPTPPADAPQRMKSGRSLGEELVLASSKPLIEDLSTSNWPNSNLPVVFNTSLSASSSESQFSESDMTKAGNEVQSASLQQKDESQEPKVQYGSLITAGSYIYRAKRAQEEDKTEPTPSEERKVSVELDVATTSAEKDSIAMSALARTMIGDWLWKYTRKVVGNGLSEHRHKRFFWIHPYTRMLCWSKQEPGLKGSEQTKSVMIESFIVVGDNQEGQNEIKVPCLIIQTPTRSVAIQCRDKETFQTWTTSLEYLYTIHQAAQEAGVDNLQSVANFHSTRLSRLLKTNPPRSVQDFKTISCTGRTVESNVSLDKEQQSYS